MKRQRALALATGGVVASLAVMVMVGSAFGIGPAADEPEWSEEPAATAATDYDTEQRAYERALAEYREAQAAAAQAQVDADWAAVLEQRSGMQASVAAELEVERERALRAIEAQIAVEQSAAAADLQAWLDDQRQAALDQLAAEIEARDQAALDELARQLAGQPAGGADVTYQYVSAVPATAPSSTSETASEGWAQQGDASPTGEYDEKTAEHLEELQKKISECERKDGEEQEECFEEVAKKRREWDL